MCEQIKEVSKDAKPSIEPKLAPISWRSQNLYVREKLDFMLNSTDLHDVTFLVGRLEDKISCNKFMLILSSDVFDAMFTGPVRSMNIDEPIKIPDVHPAAFRTLLKFIYTDKFDTLLEHALEVLYVAEKYNISSLVTQIVAFLQFSISDKYAVSIYQAASLLNEPELSAKAYTHITQNFNKIALGNDFLNLSHANLAKIISDDDTNCQEVGIFQGAIRWAKEQCKSNGLDVNAENFRIVLKEVVKLIRFPLMGAEDFAMKVCPTNILTEMDKVNVFKTIFSPFKREGHPEFKSSWNNYPRKNLIFLARPCENLERTLLHSVGNRTTTGYFKIFKVNRPIILVGLLIESICNQNDTDTVILDVMMGEKKIKVYSQKHNLLPASQQLLCLKLNTMVPVQSNTVYIIELKLLSEAVHKCKWHHETLPVACSTMGEVIFSSIGGQLPVNQIQFSFQQ